MEITSANSQALSQGLSLRSTGDKEAHQLDNLPNHKPVTDGNSTTAEVEKASNDPFIKVYTGTYRSGAVNDPVKSERIDNILDRLSKNEQAALIDNNTLLLDEKFLQLAEELSDDELRQFVAISSALQTAPLVGGDRSSRAYSGTGEVENLVNSLSGMDTTTRSRVLDKAEGYAENVIKRPPSKPVYEAQDIWNYVSAAGTANDLFNFNVVISESDDIDGVLDKLEQFDEHQQKQMLGVLRRDTELGNTLMDQLEGREASAQNAILDYMTELDLARKEYIKYNPLGDTRTKLDFDNSGHTVLVGMMEDTVSLLENYRFDDEQLKQMGEQLQQMERSDQRAYLVISKTGLETLLGDPASATEQIDLSQHEDAFETIDRLRNDLQVRELVFKSRVGEESIHDGERFYELKTLGEANHDVEEMVRFLTTDAWLNNKQEDSSAHKAQTTRLTNKLSEMGADQRDQLIQDLNNLGQEEYAVTAFSESALKTTYGAFFDRTTSIANVDDLNALAEAEAETPPALRESFWQATELAGDRVDDLLSVLEESTPELREQLIVTLAEQSALTESEEKTRDEVDQDLGKLIHYLKEDHNQEDKLSYLERVF